MNVIRHTPDLGQVIMPMIRCMAQLDLSWADRAKFAEAIQRCADHWKSMEDERLMLEQRNCQQAIGAVGFQEQQESNDG